MKPRFLRASALMLFSVISVASVSVHSVRSARSASRDGRGLLDGMWDYSTMTPLERTDEFANRAFFTEAEAAAFERGDSDRLLHDLPELEQKLNADLVGDSSTADRGRVGPSRRTSLLIDPPDGKLPPPTPQEKTRRQNASKARKEPQDDPEVLPASARCLPDFAGPPLLPTDYNNNVQIVVTPSHVAIVTEMIHETRIVPLDGRPHLPRGIVEWDGDSRGRWEGDTLVIDTTNFAQKSLFADGPSTLHVVERLTAVGASSLRYEFTVEEPARSTAPWSGTYTLHRTTNRMYEFACHEGNYSIVGMLKGARAQQR
jgi:hypothetical protein